MKLEHVTIANFRCFGPDPIRLDFESNVTALVGNNGSGKTAVLAALAKLFGTSSTQRSLHKSDFHVPKNEPELPSGANLTIDCTLGFPELDEDEADDDSVPEVFHHMATEGEDAPLKVRMRLQAVWLDDGTPEGTIEEEFRWVTAVDDGYDWDECRPVQAVERNYIQLIYVPASRNGVEQVTNLLKGRLWRAARWSKELGDEVDKSSKSIQDQFDDEEPTDFIIERLEKRWSEVHHGDTDTAPKLRLVESRLEELVRKAEFVFFPNEAEKTRRLDELSDGQRSLFHIALTAATLEIERDALNVDPADSVFDQEKLKRTYLTLLAIEEPENSLSPFFLSRVMTQARGIGGMNGAQVIVSSHSASILSRIEPEEVRYARLDPATRCASLRKLTLPPVASEESRYVRLAVKAYPELYFARFVVLAEGESEALVISRLAEALDFPLDRSFVPIVPLGGRFVRHFWRLLTDIGIPYATLLDLDLGRQHGGAKLIAKAVQELAAIGNTLANNKLVLDGEITVEDVDDIDDEELLEQDQDHPWLRALRREGVYFSSPIDLDFAMLALFGVAYRHPHEGGHGPHATAAAIKQKKVVTLKTGGNPALYGDVWDTTFAWYPYLFLSDSKPEMHIAALARIDAAQLAADAPKELRRLVAHIKKKVLG